MECSMVGWLVVWVVLMISLEFHVYVLCCRRCAKDFEVEIWRRILGINFLTKLQHLGVHVNPCAVAQNRIMQRAVSWRSLTSCDKSDFSRFRTSVSKLVSVKENLESTQVILRSVKGHNVVVEGSYIKVHEGPYGRPTKMIWRSVRIIWEKLRPTNLDYVGCLYRMRVKLFDLIPSSRGV